jgi:hypothetical protein
MINVSGPTLMGSFVIQCLIFIGQPPQFMVHPDLGLPPEIEGQAGLWDNFILFQPPR